MAQQHFDMNAMMQQARQMQAQLQDAEDHLKDVEVSASAGGGTVKVTATADMKITSLTIDPAAVDPDDVELLEDMVMAAVNEALESAQQAATSQIGSVTNGLHVPGLF